MSISRRKRRCLSGASFNAEVAELADAHGSGPCTRKGVGVRVPSSAPALKLWLTFIFSGWDLWAFFLLPKGSWQESAFLPVLDIC
jgi:hypothetical protein